DGAALDRVAAEVADRLGPAEAVVANAGIAAGGPLLLADARSYDRVIEVNLLGSIRTVRAFLPQVVQTKGYVLQVASVAALLPAPMMSAYCASKSGVEAFAHSLRGEVRHHAVDVGVAYLTWTDTDMVRGADSRPGLGDMRSKLPWVFGKTYPLEPAVARMIDGIEARSPHVYAQRWVRTLTWLRGGAPSLTAHAPKRDAGEVERRLRAAGPEATLPVGAGGAADAAQR
ncbi:MAG: Short chain dehydrogenase, partial [Frankiales bacterium]|nr:Short chain dehydrogenase [Frankiales bacterium]